MCWRFEHPQLANSCSSHSLELFHVPTSPVQSFYCIGMLPVVRALMLTPFWRYFIQPTIDALPFRPDRIGTTSTYPCRQGPFWVVSSDCPSRRPAGTCFSDSFAVNNAGSSTSNVVASRPQFSRRSRSRALWRRREQPASASCLCSTADPPRTCRRPSNANMPKVHEDRPRVSPDYVQV